MLLVCLSPASFAEEIKPERLQQLAKKAQDLYQKGRYKEAIAPARELLKLTEQAAGPDHPLVAHSLNNLGLILQKDQQLTEARLLFERALQIEEAKLGAENPGIVRSLTQSGALAPGDEGFCCCSATVRAGSDDQ